MDSPSPRKQRKAVGIDLGTTFSAIAHIDPYGKPQIIPNTESERITPSVILFDGANAVVGENACLNNCIIWENAHIAPGSVLENCIISTGRSVEGTHRDEDF